MAHITRKQYSSTIKLASLFIICLLLSPWYAAIILIILALKRDA